MMRSLCAVTILLVGVMLTGCNSQQKPAGGTAQVAPSTPGAASPQVPTVHADGVRRVTTVELHDMLAKNQAFVVDVRTEQSYKQGHIRGAKLIPVADVLQKSGELPKDKLIVTYCS